MCCRLPAAGKAKNKPRPFDDAANQEPLPFGSQVSTPALPKQATPPQSPDASRQSRRKIELLCAWSLQLLIPIKTNLPVRLTPDRAQRNLSTTASPINPLFLHHR